MTTPAPDIQTRQLPSPSFMLCDCGRAAWALVFRAGKLFRPTCVTHLAEAKGEAVRTWQSS